MFDEKALPEPQRIKQELIDQYFQGCDLVPKIIMRTIQSQCQDVVNQQKLSMICQSLVLKLSSKDSIKESKAAQDAIKKTLAGKLIPFKTCCELIIVFGEIFDEIGITKIEITGGVKPEYAAIEGHFVDS